MQRSPCLQTGRLARSFLALTLGLGLLIAASAEEAQLLRLITTTTVENSGLTAHLIPAFERDSGLTVQVIAVGTGRALKLLANGDVDIALTHARRLEEALVKSGGAIDHRLVMYNDFILAGPPSDPAGAGRATTIVEAFRAIALTRNLFLSRGDKSGTHVRERALWLRAAIEPHDDWYRLAGQGMGKTLLIAGELDAYTLVDRGTWLAYREKSPLAVIFEGGDLLLNEYSVLSANSARHPSVNASGARAFTDWIESRRAKDLIREFVIDGQPLFVPVP